MRLYGNTTGLKPSHVKKLLKLYQRKIPPDELITTEFARELTEITSELHKQVGVLVDRKGHIGWVIVGSAGHLMIPDIGRFGSARGKLRGIRLLHTHLKGEGITKEDLTDLRILSLDTVAALTLRENGIPDKIHVAYLLPQNHDQKIWEVMKPVPYHMLNLPFQEFITSLEGEMTRAMPKALVKGKSRERAIIVYPNISFARDLKEEVKELKELCNTAGVEVAGVVVQNLQSPDPRFVVGKGKLEEIVLRSMQAGIDLLIFGCELLPSQVRSIADFVDVRVIDRTQLILDIFAQRAQTQAGKIQVELAQLKYMLPRLREKDTALSRLTGGIGARGPGETKLEIQRRRLKERILRLENEIERIGRQRLERRKLRQSKNIPVVAIVGYTNAGKSTLLNTITKSRVFVENKLFATLDPASRRVKFPENREIIITDTVGFIHDLPKDLIAAFKATLEEIEEAAIIVHLVDASASYIDDKIGSVNSILSELCLDRIPQILVLNKIDIFCDMEKIDKLKVKHDAVALSATNPYSTIPLIKEIERRVFQN